MDPKANSLKLNFEVVQQRSAYYEENRQKKKEEQGKPTGEFILLKEIEENQYDEARMEIGLPRQKVLLPRVNVKRGTVHSIQRTGEENDESEQSGERRKNKLVYRRQVRNAVANCIGNTSRRKNSENIEDKCYEYEYTSPVSSKHVPPNSG
jgi:hypothetical protein